MGIVKALVLIMLFVVLLSGAALSMDVRSVLALVGVFATCWAVGWLISPEDR